MTLERTRVLQLLEWERTSWAVPIGRAAFIWLRLRLYLDGSPSPGMAHANPSPPRPASYHGEVWTIATDQPHMKVAWRVTGQPRHRQQREE
jgi:hypothetical protein